MNIATLYQIGEDGAETARWNIHREPVVVGRSGKVQVNVQDDGLSRQHFLIAWDGEDYVIKDLNSRNGTWVNGHRVFAEKLRDYGHILAGHTRFLFAAPPAPSAAVGTSVTGPHGTVIVSAVPMLERDSTEAAR